MAPAHDDVVGVIKWLRTCMRMTRVRMVDMLVPLATTEDELKPVLAEMRRTGHLRLTEHTGWEVR